MPGGIDYSKWDHLDEYSEDEDDHNDEGQPRVTRLDGPSEVTFGGGSATVQPSQGAASTSALHPPQKQLTEKFVSAAAKSKVATNNDDPFQNWKASGGEESIEDGQRRLFWSQDRYSICIRVELVKEEKVGNVLVEHTLSYSDRYCAVGTVKPRLMVLLKDGKCLLEGDLPHPVHFAQSEDEIEWSVERAPSNERFLAVTLYKAVPMQGLSLWWRRPLMCFDEIELKKESTQTSNEFLEAWDEAHRLFREKKRTPG
eukprot:scaffold9846_cov122-Cylindrotheca_fusiformis.AAC.5